MVRRQEGRRSIKAQSRCPHKGQFPPHTATTEKHTTNTYPQEAILVSECKQVHRDSTPITVMH